MKTKTITTKKEKVCRLEFVLPLAMLLFFCPLFIYDAGAAYNYIPMEKVPGFEEARDFPAYLLAITKFALWAVGIAALFMIGWGGFMYMTSAGNTSRAESAKGIISDAIFGLLVALAAWLLLFVINPEMVKIDLSLSPVADRSATGPPVVPANVPPVPPGTVPSLNRPSNCVNGKCPIVDSYIQNNKYGVNPAILKALIDGGEGCNPNKSSAGACGYSQVMPSIRAWCGIQGDKEQTCTAVQKDIQLAIDCAAKLLKLDMLRRCGTSITTVASCYNTGKSYKCGQGMPPYCQRVTTYYSTKCN